MKPYKIVDPPNHSDERTKLHPARAEGGLHYNMVQAIAEQVEQPFYMRPGNSGYYPVAYFDAGCMLYYRDMVMGKPHNDFVFSPAADRIGQHETSDALEMFAHLLDYFRR